MGLRPCTLILVLSVPTAMLCGGCAHGVTRLYEGDPRPLKELSQVYNTPAAALIRLDGRNVLPSLRTVPAGDWRYEFDPGWHSIEVAQVIRQSLGDKIGDDRATFSHDFQPGRTYSFVVSEFRSQGNVTWSATLIDYDTGHPVTAPDGPPRLQKMLPRSLPGTTAAIPRVPAPTSVSSNATRSR